MQEVLVELPSLYQRLNPEEQESFKRLIAQSPNTQTSVASQESRALKRKITAQLQEHNLENARYIADLLVDIGVREDITFLHPL
ncbi:MAG: hypothetical protein HC936_08275 [Leptolyngbyaceae cyanobacterium SU_3_3]|nr:hypothetical protein [Leptolyngbyaceae cyanobacterium SU_3_3]